MGSDHYGVNSGVEVQMSAVCPNCSHDDQVRSAQTIYAEQNRTGQFSGTTVGVAWAGGLVPAVGTTQISGSQASLLLYQADRAAYGAPPPLR